ncbi:MAG: type II secretion system protein GspG, partial [Candidatus Binatia bacterium]
LWTVWRSDSHATGEKVALSIVSASLTGLIVFAAVTALPDQEDRLAARRQRVAAQLETLVALVERYRSENGSLPDEKTWELSTKRSDPRFVDPWQRRYLYERRDGGFVVGTYGDDGMPGGEGDDRDVFVQAPENAR